MKLKGKLILSCAALAAVATTAFSTTYAWYTSNATVTADGVSVGTTPGGSDSLQISKDALDWKTTVDLEINTQSLVPVSYGADGKTADGTYLLWDQASNDVSTSGTAGSAYVEFNLFFRNIATDVATSKVYLDQLLVTNTTTGGLPATKTLSGQGLLASPTAANVANKPVYKMDILRALDLELVSKEITVDDGAFVGNEAGDAVTLANDATGVTTKVFGFDTNYKDTTTANLQDDWIADTTNAHKYYNDVKGLTGDDKIAETDPLATASSFAQMANLKTKAANAAGALELGGAHGQTYLKTTWRLFLNGWDLCCFDAVKGQKITMSMSFTTFNVQS